MHTVSDSGRRAAIAEIARGLAAHETGLSDALAAIRYAISADRVSIAAIRETSAGSVFEIVLASGEALLQPGTRFPLHASTHHTRAADGAAFVSQNFDRQRGFSRAVDRVVRAHGFRSGAALPLTHHTGSVGVLNFHFNAEGARVERAVAMVMPITGALAVALAVPRTTKMRVLVCHDDPLLGRGIARLLEEQASVEPVVARTVDAALSLAVESDVIVCDHSFGARPLESFADALRAARILLPIVVIAHRTSPAALAAAASVGASAFLSHGDLELSLAPTVTAIIVDRTWADRAVEIRCVSPLTPREIEVVAALDRGLRLAQIATELGVSNATIKAHARNLFRKLGATSRAEATYAARRRGLIP